MNPVRVAVVGAGSFGRNHLRVLRQLDGVVVAGVTDTDPARAEAAAAEFGCPVLREVTGAADAAIVAVPTTAHAAATLPLLEAGLDVLVEKPIAHDLAAARRMSEAAARRRRVLQVGHLERFNPAVEALARAVTVPLFFEVHRLNVFSARSLDVDVVLDLMIHDLDIVLSMTRAMPTEIRAAGLAILTDRVDIANVRLAFANGCIANFTASRVSTERVRKLRLFQPSQYISVDYQKQEAAVFSVSGEVPDKQIDFEMFTPPKMEPLRSELAAFIDCVRTRRPPRVGGDDGTRALEVSLAILDNIEEHVRIVASTLSSWRGGTRPRDLRNPELPHA
ncbi:MAG TPA: Gfo/Idh/MocA family oxidoreductase [Bryobacteraceae bacterium]|nr:Gfo/Idh/MocA family oxidoreductase [Bryobacteraceae bacterium]